MPLPRELPLVCGHEPVGVVDKVGDGVNRLEVGDRVGVVWSQGGCGRCTMCMAAREKFCPNRTTWMHLGGGHATSMLARETGCVILPDELSFENAAPLLCAGYTVMSGYRQASPRAGDRVAVLGIGGLGHIAIQCIKALGHEVVAVTNTAGKEKLAADLGADDVLVVKEDAGKELLAMGGADLVLATGNSPKQAAQIVGGIRPEGALCLLGLGAEPFSMNPAMAMLKQLRIVGTTPGHRRDLIEVFQLAAKGRVSPMLEIFSLEDVNDAMVKLAAGKMRFRAVLKHV